MDSRTSGSLVLVTGADGFLGSHCVSALLGADFNVRAAISAKLASSKAKEVRLLKTADATGTLEVVELDCRQTAHIARLFRALRRVCSWPQRISLCRGLTGVDYVVHAVPLPEVTARGVSQMDELSESWALGVLEASEATGLVRKVVLASSLDAVSGGAASGDRLDEERWSRLEDGGISPSERQAAAAERAAWTYLDRRRGESKMELCVLCLGCLLGPPLLPSDAPGLKQVKDLLSGRTSCLPDVSFAYTDARDASQAIVAALKRPAANGQRIIVHNGVRKLADIAAALSQEFSWLGYRVPTRVAFFVELWVASFFNWDLQAMLKRSGIHYTIHSFKGKPVWEVEELHEAIHR